ncbi:hypothetical protein Cgig2_004810 [Carnegiea gigantea]|uniref:Vacuolar protein sorting-associated protein 13 VPS13 adaptor binding domain-containing protein n=1 Tax=Carnegiea gigantea TaxID=171969 RepID=A0A9Q1KVK1_9CARY|nr:hypothetical protein Cgig2_004810 [Carnegiea gigantea]
MIWDVNLVKISISLPWDNMDSQPCSLVTHIRGLWFSSKFDYPPASEIDDKHEIVSGFLKMKGGLSVLNALELRDMYDHYDLNLDDLQITLMTPHFPHGLSVVEKFCASVSLDCCIIPDEVELKQLEANFVISSLQLQFSASVYCAILSLVDRLHLLASESEQGKVEDPLLPRRTGSRLAMPFFCSLVANFKAFKLELNLEDDGDSRSILQLCVQDLNLRYAQNGVQDCWVSANAVDIISYEERNECKRSILCSSTLPVDTDFAHPREMQKRNADDGEQDKLFDRCFHLHYGYNRIGHLIRNICTIHLSNTEFHCYPDIVRSLVGFCDKVMACDRSRQYGNSFSQMESKQSEVSSFGFQRFGLSNFYEDEFAEWASIPVDQFPFITMRNSGGLHKFDNAIIPEWRSLSVREKNITSLPSFEILMPELKVSDESDCHLLGSPDTSFLHLAVNILSINVYFHDASCIVSSITLPAGKASVTSHSGSCDVLCSVEGLRLFSSWWTYKFQEFLWGPSQPNLSPILNIRVRRGVWQSSSDLEISFGIQHVCCVVPPDYLAVLIGYFSLPDWSSTDNEHQFTENGGHISESDATVYNFEILDSIIMSPVESNENQFLKLDAQHLCCSFIHNDTLEKASNDIFSEFSVPVDKVAEDVHSLDIFGRNSCLSLLLLEDDGSDTLPSDEITKHDNHILVPSFSFDLWIRLPNGSEPSQMSSSTRIMMNLTNCEIVAEDSYFFSGFQALLDVVEQHSWVGKESKCFTQDVPEFIKLKKSLKDTACGFSNVSSSVLTEIRCCVDSLSVKLISSKGGSNFQNILAKIDSCFMLSATVKDDILLNLDVHFSSLLLSSLLNSIYLARCSPDHSSSSVLDIHMSTIKRNEIKLLIALPSLEIWLHMFDWSMLIDFLDSCIQGITLSSLSYASDSNNLLVDNPSETPPHSHPTLTFEFTSASEDFSVTVRSENIGLSCHVPLWVSEEAIDQSDSNGQTGANVELLSQVSGWKDSKFLTVTLHSRSSELFTHGTDMKIRINVEKATGSVGICESGTVRSWPFFQLFQLGADIQICEYEKVPVAVKVDINCEAFNVWLSHQVFYFWHGVDFGAAKADSSDITSGSVDLNMQLRKVSLLLTDGRWLCSWVVDFIVLSVLRVALSGKKSINRANIRFAHNGYGRSLHLKDHSTGRHMIKDSQMTTAKRHFWSCNGPLMELLMRNLRIEMSLLQNTINFATEGDLFVNYNNIHKVMWEPFVEPWSFQINLMRKFDNIALLDTGTMTEVQLESTTELNVNVTTSLFEVVLRAIDMIKEARGLMQINEVPKSQRFQNYQCVENLCVRRYASYTIRNMTSLPFVFHVYEGLGSAENVDNSVSTYECTVPPGSSVPIYIDGTLEEQVFNYRPAPSSEGLCKKASNRAGHHFMTIQFEGTSQRSEPISMDLVGLTYFEVNFSKDNNEAHANSGFLVPVVFDVSVQQYSKLIQLYSTVIFTNLTSVPLELRFDIPFGMTSKIVDPIYPGEEFPLPLHLAEAGHMRWRPLGNNYLWSEVHNLSKILSTESRSGFLRSLVCYPSHPSSHLFRCCLSVQDISLPSSGRLKRRSPHVNINSKQQVQVSDQLHNHNDLKTRFIHRVTLTTPLTVKSYLPQTVSVTIEGGGVGHTALLNEVEAAFFHFDSSHDLAVTFHIAGCRPSAIKFPRADTFNATAKPGGTGLLLTETIAFVPDLSYGAIYVTVEKMMDPASGARELCLFVPFLLYNCTGFALTISRSDHELQGNCYTVPSCYDSTEQGLFIDQRNGLCLVSSEESRVPRSVNFTNERVILNDHVLSSKEIASRHSGILLRQSSMSHSSSLYRRSVNQRDLVAQEAASMNSNRQLDFHDQSEFKASNVFNEEFVNSEPYMYSPDPSAAASEIMVQVSRCHPESTNESLHSSSWSSPFFLVAPSGSTVVLVPQPSTNSAAVISVTSHLLDGPLTGRTRAITFQPRYVITNACSKDLCYKQKGTDFIFRLSVGQHSHLHWVDTTRELLTVVRFDEPGWQWSGSFLPDDLGDTQVKMRNYASGALNIIRVEVQNADALRDEHITGNIMGNSGTIFILLSDDDTGFVPYRIDNFSKETLRVYQQKCETLETIVHPYTSCPYAWDEPSYPHRLIVEVPGERIIGSYTLDDVREYAPVRLSSSSSSSSKVLSIIDSSCHVLGEVKSSTSLVFGKKSDSTEVAEKLTHYKEKISVRISSIGISLIDSYPQELLYGSAKGIKVDLFQSMEQQRFSFQISSLQIDNQLRGTPYPVILSFDEDYKSSLVNHIRNKDGGTITRFESMLPYASGSSCKPVFCLLASKWKNKEMMLNAEHLQSSGDDEFPKIDCSSSACHSGPSPLPNMSPIGAPWQKIFLLARRQNKIYVEAFYLAPIKLTLSFSSSPWMVKKGGLTSGESLIHRGIMALADIEGAQICLRELTITHHMASWESIQEILFKHYTRQFLHEMYKVFGSAGVIGNPMGFARRVGLGVKDFLSVPAKGALQSPTGLISGMAQGTSSLLSNMLYAISDTATQFSKAAHKGILAFTFDDHEATKMEKQRVVASSRTKGVISELLEGLTGLLQSPIKGAEKHGLPGVLSGFALGVTGLVAKPAASVLEVTGRTAQSIRNRSRLHRMGPQRLRVRLPRYLSAELPLRPYSWEDAVGTAVLLEVDDGLKFKDEVLVSSKSLKDAGKFVVLTEKLILIIKCSSLADLGKPEFRGVVTEPEWTVEVEVALESVIHADVDGGVVHIVGSSSETLVRQNQLHQKRTGVRMKQWNEPQTPLPLFQTNLELTSKEEAEYFLRVLLSTIEQGKEQGWGNVYLLHQINIK